MTELRNNLPAVSDTMQSFPRQSSPFIVSFYTAPNNHFHAATSSTKIVRSCGSFSSFSYPFLMASANQLANCSVLTLDCSGGFFAISLQPLQHQLLLPHSLTLLWVRRCGDSSSSSTHYDITALHISRNSSFLSKVSFLLHLFKTGGQKLYLKD